MRTDMCSLTPSFILNGKARIHLSLSLCLLLNSLSMPTAKAGVAVTGAVLHQTYASVKLVSTVAVVSTTRRPVTRASQQRTQA